MLRRTALTTIGATIIPLTGCSGQSSPETNSAGTTPSSTQSPGQGNDRTTSGSHFKTTMDAGISHNVTLTGKSDADLRDTFGIAAHVSVLESSVTTAHTARVQVTLENVTGQSVTLTYTRDTCDLNLITGQYQQDEDIHLLLISTEQAWKRVEGDCWVPDGRNLNCGIPAKEHQISIAPDEPLRWTFRLWASPEAYTNGVCMPPGAYQFTRELRQEETAVPLSFTLSVDSR